SRLATCQKSACTQQYQSRKSLNLYCVFHVSSVDCMKRLEFLRHAIFLLLSSRVNAVESDPAHTRSFCPRSAVIRAIARPALRLFLEFFTWLLSRIAQDPLEQELSKSLLIGFEAHLDIRLSRSRLRKALIVDLQVHGF